MITKCCILDYMPPSVPTAFFVSASTFIHSAAPYFAAAGLLAALFALSVTLRLRARLNRLSLGRNGSLEESLAILSRDMKELQAFRKELETYLKHVEQRLQGSVQGIGVVRFNPFSGDGSGGNQSFAAALLDEKLSGVVLSAIHARDHIGVYAKPIDKGSSTFELTGEERSAIEKAQQAIQKPKRDNTGA